MNKKMILNALAGLSVIATGANALAAGVVGEQSTLSTPTSNSLNSIDGSIIDMTRLAEIKRSFKPVPLTSEAVPTEVLAIHFALDTLHEASA